MPFVFVTNGTYSSKILLNTLHSTLQLPFTEDHIVVAPSPCTDLTQYHNKRVLVCCQEDSIELIRELGFTNHILISDLVELFPELDYVDHKRRKYIKVGLKSFYFHNFKILIKIKRNIRKHRSN